MQRYSKLASCPDSPGANEIPDEVMHPMIRKKINLFQKPIPLNLPIGMKVCSVDPSANLQEYLILSLTLSGSPGLQTSAWPPTKLTLHIVQMVTPKSNEHMI